MRQLIPFLLLALSLAAQEPKPPSKLVFPSKSGAVTFNHTAHVTRQKGDCEVCHDKLVPKSAKAPLSSKTACAPCHQPEGKAFAMKGNCGRCHGTAGSK